MTSSWTRRKIIIVGIVAALILIRLMLPFFVKRYVNNVLADLPGYTGHIDDVDLHLYRGAYQIYGLEIFKVDGNEKLPFVSISIMDLSIEWKALFKGALVGEIVFEEPVLNFIGGGSEDDQSGEDVDWTVPVKELFPMKFNRLEVRNGSITFNDLTTKPQVKIFLNNIYGVASNLSNVVNEDELLPSNVTLTAQSIGQGELSVNMNINALKSMPDFDMDMQYENVDLTALNDFFEAYAKVDVERGDFFLYTELAVMDGEVEGYVKPIVEDLQVADWEKDKDKPLRFIWESIVGFLTDIFKNQPHDRFATQIPLSGTITNVETSFWPAVWNIFKNAFVKAFEKNTDGSVNILRNRAEKEKQEKE